MLQDKLNGAGREIIPADRNKFIPAAEDSIFWEDLPEGVKETLLLRGKKALQEEIPPLPATLFMDFYRTGNRSRFEIPYFQRRVLLIRMTIAYCAGERNDEMLDGIINLLSALCDEWTWVLPAHNWPLEDPLPPVEPPRVDLFAANTASLVSLTVHLLADPLEKAAGRLVDRAKTECSRRCIRPFMENNRHWWMGYEQIGNHGSLNNWTPWITDNFLHTLFLLHETREELVRGVNRAGEILNHYLEAIPSDGGCDEGPSYWDHAVGSLYGCLDVMNFMTGGSLGLLRDTFLTKAALYLKHVHIGGEYFANFADCPGKLNHLPSGLIYRMALSSDSRELRDLALSLTGVAGRDTEEWSAEEAFSPHRIIRDLMFPMDRGMKDGSATLAPPDEYLVYPETQVYIKRSGPLYFSCKGGHNGESHNHNDTGQFILYYGGYPLLIDPGVGDYTRETFSDKRYSIWTMQSLWHNLPLVNGQQQKEGREFFCSSFLGGEDFCRISMGGAYPPEADLDRWQREFSFPPGGSELVLTDSWSCRRTENSLTWSFLTLEEPEPGEGKISVRSGPVIMELSYPVDLLRTEREEKAIPEDDHKMRSWGRNILWKVTLSGRAPFPAEDAIEFNFRFINQGESYV